MDLNLSQLQAIAMGYLISSLLYLHTRIRTQIIIAVLLLLGYWGAMEFITIQGQTISTADSGSGYYENTGYYPITHAESH